MNRRTFVRPEAQINIREAAFWYEQRETGLGHRFMGEFGLDPNNSVFYWARGHAYDENANNVGPIENYTKAISLMTSNSSTLITYGGKSINLIDLYEDRASS